MTGYKIPFTGTKRQYKNLSSELLATADQVWSSGRHLDGQYTQMLEEAIAHRCNRKYAVAVNSGTQALIFALKALRLPKESRVMIPSISFIATLNSVVEAGLNPYIVDTDYNGLMDLTRLQQQFGAYGTKAIMPVNLYGLMADYDQIKVITEFFGGSNDVAVIEDAAQSFGAYYKGKPSGSFGDVSILSFDPMKNLNNAGSGGMLLTDDEELYHIFRDMRNNGKQLGHIFSGTNSKMSELDCATLLVKLHHFDDWQSRRTDIADYYRTELRPYVRVLEHNEDVIPSWHKFPIFDEFRQSIADHLSAEGIETKIHYDTLLADTPLYNPSVSPYASGFEYVDYDSFYGEASREVSLTTLSLPIYPELTDEEVEHVITSVVESAR